MYRQPYATLTPLRRHRQTRPGFSAGLLLALLACGAATEPLPEAAAQPARQGPFQTRPQDPALVLPAMGWEPIVRDGRHVNRSRP